MLIHILIKSNFILTYELNNYLCIKIKFDLINKLKNEQRRFQMP
jgi:hypothetical protein